MSRTALRVGVLLVLGVVALVLALQIARLVAYGVALAVLVGAAYLVYRLYSRASGEGETTDEYGLEGSVPDEPDVDVESELDSLLEERDADRELEYE